VLWTSRLMTTCAVVIACVAILTQPIADIGAPGGGAGRNDGCAPQWNVDRSAPDGGALLVAPADAGPVATRVREIAVPAVRSAAPAGLAAQSGVEPVRGFGVVGATWQGSAPAGLRLAVRTRTGEQEWSSWIPLELTCPCTRAELAAGEVHGPDPGSLEARDARAGTDPLVVGEVDLVQLRATSASGRAPRDLELSVINPGRSAADDDPILATRPVSFAPGTVARGALPRVPARPVIRSRRAWGANERLRSRAPTFGVVRAGFVHHTVNSNAYSRADVPAIIRGIYAFHTQSNGWSDIGYNFVVDRFGRIWEGRFGGVGRNVIGAHTLGYNHLSFAMSAIGNFQAQRPPAAVVHAYGRLMAWKLALNGVRAGRDVRMRGRVFRAISGHRDAGSTACPGIFLYRQIPQIRALAVAVQRGTPPPAPTPTPTPTPTETDNSGPGGGS
jgi:hypothetical protein